MENNTNNTIENQPPVDNHNAGEDEIDLVEIIQKLWKNRKFIIKVTIAFALLGFIVAISTPNVYTASCTMVPQTGQKNAGGSLGGLAAMAGINLGSMTSGEVLSPNVYPKIMTNVNFQKELIYSIGVIKKYTIGLPGLLITAIRGNETAKTKSDTSIIQTLTAKEQGVIKMAGENLSLSINSKDGFVSLSANMPEPLVAAELAQKGQELLQKYITEFKVAKVASNLVFVERSFDEAQKNFEQKQSELARFRDANKSFSSAMARTQEEKLTSEYNLLLGIYTELAKQKEQAKISVTETTPILTVIEPVVVPIEKSKPSRMMILIIYSSFGFILGVGMLFVFPYIKKSYRKIKS